MLRPLPATFCAVFLSLLPSTAFAWGNEGHRAVARLAQGRLTTSAKTGVRTLLGRQVTLESVALWADAIKPQRGKTKPWHYVDIPVNGMYDATAHCPNDACVIAKITAFQAVLADTTQPRAQRAEALKFLVHFVGDIHQPLHCADNNDRGGNERDVALADGSTNNLHAVWDTALVRWNGVTRNAYDQRLATLATTLPTNMPTDPRAWATESHTIAHDLAYPLVDDDELSTGEADQAANTADTQIAKAGMRLATLLNNAFP